MSLDEIKNQVAKENNWINWSNAFDDCQNEMWPEVCRRACEETGRLTLEKAAESAVMCSCGFSIDSHQFGHCPIFYKDEFHGFGENKFTPDSIEIKNKSNIVIVK